MTVIPLDHTLDTPAVFQDEDHLRLLLDLLLQVEELCLVVAAVVVVVRMCVEGDRRNRSLASARALAPNWSVGSGEMPILMFVRMAVEILVGIAIKDGGAWSAMQGRRMGMVVAAQARGFGHGEGNLLNQHEGGKTYLRNTAMRSMSKAAMRI